MAGNINEYLIDTNCIGIVENVDTRKVVVQVENESVLNTLKINDIVVLGGSNSDEKLIGILTKVTKKKIDFDETEQDEGIVYSSDYCIINLVGSFYNKYGVVNENKFKRAINTYPEINSKVYQANEATMKMIMNAISGKGTEYKSLEIGHFASNRDVAAILDGNRFFQRHACIVGSTGSGKSYTVAGILEKANELQYANMIVFDLHGEYNALSYADQIKICDEPGGLHIPLWFFNYEEIHSLFVESSEGTSTNQRAAVINYILQTKKKYMYDIRYINMYHVLDRKEDAIRLIEKNINTLKKEKQYSSLRKGLLQAIDIANSSCDRALEIKYLIELLEIITIQKEVTTDEAKIYIDRLDYYSQSKILSLKEECALSFFKIKREFKLGTYTKTSNCAIELAKSYYDNCVNRIYTDNTNDWLGRICSCYALLIKSTQGNESALKIFESALKIFPTSFDLRREYWSHIGCMHLFDDPLKSYQNYQQILTLFKEAPDSAAFPFHEYGDLALCQLVAHDFPMAYLLTKDALKIGYANGVLDEEGRCLNIRGCIEWCQGNLSAAEASFHEAITIMQYSEYNHYLWRSQLNILQLSLITGNYSAERYSILEMVYTNFFDLLAVKINALSKLDSNFFRKTIEYHALIILGVLLDQITDNKRKHLKICDEFNLGKHDTLYQKDVTSFLIGNYYFIDSPYIQNGYIFFVG